MQELDQLINTLAFATQSSAAEPGDAMPSLSQDAIDRELAASLRTTKVVSLTDSPEVNAFRSELVDGMIRVDTVNQFLKLVNQVITQFLL